MKKEQRPEQRNHTTARTSMRMDATAKSKLAERIAPYALDMEADFAQFKTRELEVGMGNGLALLQRAKAAPNTLFLGNEVYLNGVKSLVHALEKTPDIHNVRILTEDGRDVLNALPHNCLSRILVPFPDPWPKSRHHKRRIVQPDFLTLAHQKLALEGDFWVITDIADYALFALSHLYHHPSFKALTPQPNFGTAPSWWVETKYQKKAAKEGRLPWFIEAQPSENIDTNLGGRYSHSTKA